MDYYIDLSALDSLIYMNPLAISWTIFLNGGWVIVLFTLLWGFWQMWVYNIQGKYAATVKYVLLAIDVPKSNEQSVKAMEQIFAHLAGSHFNPNLIEKYWEGKFCLSYSLEIISIDGYIQFLIRTPADYRDLVESAIYAQYPDAEVTEVRDYVDTIPGEYPNDEFDLWGTQIVLAKEDAYPIRTYPEFEHSLSSLEQQFLDPLAAILEAMSRLTKGEQVWLQLVVTPLDESWKDKGVKIVKKLIKAKIEEKSTIFDKALDLPINVLGELSNQILSTGGTAEKPKEAQPSIMQHLSPGEKTIVEGIERKIAKMGFMTRFRMIYAGRKEVFQKGRGVSSIFGTIKQFNTQNLNAFKPHKKITTKVNYFFTKYRTNLRKTKIYLAYKYRSTARGANGNVLNNEELATIFHFPAMTVKAPLLKKTEGKKAEPPVSLPMGDEMEELIRFEGEEQPSVTEEKAEVRKDGLPFDYNNPYFEEKFALKKVPKPSSASSSVEVKKGGKVVEDRPSSASSFAPPGGASEDRTEGKEPPHNLPFVE